MRTNDDTWDINTSVGTTALGVAAGRAAETSRSAPLIHDPYAEKFLQAADSAVPLSSEAVGRLGGEFAEFWDGMCSYVAVRTKFFDDFFESAAQAGIEQAVILASGLDTRPYRSTMPARTFEIDQPAVLDFKARVLGEADARARTDNTTVSIDLRDDWRTALIEQGFSTERRTAWLAEGLLPYLPASAQQDLFTTIDSLSAPGSRVSVEHFPKRMSSMAHHPVVQQGAEFFGSDISDLWFDEEPIDVAGWLNTHGWSAQVAPATDMAADYGRPLDEKTTVSLGASQYLTATKG